MSIWLNNTRKSHTLDMCNIFLGIAQLAPFIAIIAWLISKSLGTALVIFMIAFLFGFIYDWMFFNLITCPKCKYNPTRTKEGRKKKVGHASIRTSLDKLEQCPKCNDNGIIKG